MKNETHAIGHAIHISFITIVTKAMFTNSMSTNFNEKCCLGAECFSYLSFGIHVRKEDVQVIICY